MKKPNSQAFLMLIVLAMVSSVGCTFDGSTVVGFDAKDYRGCYEEVNDELGVVLNLGLPETTISNNDGSVTTNSNQLYGCLTFRKNEQPVEGPFLLTGSVKNNTTTAKLTAYIPFAEEIEVELTRNVQIINLDEVVFISIKFPGGPPMDNIRRQFPEYVEDTMCPIRCPQEEAP